MAGKGDNDNRDRSEIMDISDTPDVAVWAKEASRGAGTPPDGIKGPSKNSSMTLRIVTKTAATTTTTKTAEKEGGRLVDPASKKEMAKVSAARATLTDESEYAKRE